jgi:ABC-2 type transport system ATP-binding protein
MSTESWIVTGPRIIKDLAVNVRGLCKRYGDKQAVDWLHLTVHRGEIFKGCRRRDDGTVSVLGVDPATAGLARRSWIGIVLRTANDPGRPHRR